jgi:hypothetical protein
MRIMGANLLHVLVRITVVAGAVFLAGCESHVVPVSGRVTLNGKPLAGAVVTFQPHGARDSTQPATTGSVGRTDEQGRFSLQLVAPEQAGAAVGEHVVTISTATGGSDEKPATGRPLPREWIDGSRKFKVPPGGTAEANFDIREGK